MDGNSGEHMGEEQLRKIISSYLDEVLRCYQEQQRVWPVADQSKFGQLELRANELLQAMMSSIEPNERRRAVLQVLCRATEHREPNILS